MSLLKDLKNKVPIERVLQAYDLYGRLKHRGDQVIGPCPLHGGDNPTAFRAHLVRGIWNCFTACGGGDIVDLICKIEKCSKASAAHVLQRLIAVAPAVMPSEKLHGTTIATPFRPFRRQIPLDPRAPFLQDHKGISVKTATRFEAGLPDPRSTFLQGTVAVRLHDVEGRPLGYCGRRLTPDDISRWGKWRFPTHLPKGSMLYNAHRAIAARRCGIVIVECPWAAMRLTQAGICGAVALLGTGVTETQIAWLAHAPEVLLLMDGDKAGSIGAEVIAKALRRKAAVHIHRLPPDKEPEDLSDDDLASLGAKTLPFSLNPPRTI